MGLATLHLRETERPVATYEQTDLEAGRAVDQVARTPVSYGIVQELLIHEKVRRQNRNQGLDVLSLQLDDDVDVVSRADLAIEHARHGPADEVGHADSLQTVHDRRQRFAKRQRAHAGESGSQP
ncbi:MAG: hypothetical protein ABIP94_00505 [Planctomycetota bacterium]